MKERFDLIIIGGGASAFAAAIEADRLGKKTLMVNSGLPLGGTCVNVGCVPTKIFLHSAELLNLSKKSAVPKLSAKFSFSELVRHKDKLVLSARKEKYENVLKSLKNVKFVKGVAKFVSKNEIEVSKLKFFADNFIIATGSRTFVPEIEGLKDAGYITHIEALSLKKLPKSMLILGGGPMGVEFADIFASFGVSVFLIEAKERILSYGEPELTARLSLMLENKGVKIFNLTSLLSVKKEKGKKVCLLKDKEGKTKKIKVDEILIATSRKANTESLNLKKAEVKVDKRGALIVNRYLQTNQSHIYACGDVASLPKRLETTAGHEGTIAVRNIFLSKKEFLDYRLVPSVVFSDPQYAEVGISEAEYLKKYKVCACRTVSFSKIPKAQILGREEGLIKMVINPKTERIVGVHILSKDAAELIGQALWIIKNKSTIDDVINQVSVFPSLSEAFRYAALSFKNDISKLSCCI